MAFFIETTPRMFGFRTISMLFVAVMLPACITTPAPPASACATGEQRVVSDLVYFGAGRAKGAVTQGEWDDFLRDEVTPRFPQASACGRLAASGARAMARSCASHLGC